MIAPAHGRGGNRFIANTTGAALVARRIWFLVLTLVLWSYGGVREAAAQDVVDCTAFASFDEANNYFAAHPEAASAIDDDRDGTACEVYFGLEGRDQPARSAEPAAGAVLQLAQKEKGDLDCEDFQTQEEAQAVLLSDPADPNNLDPNGDGVACALLPLAADLEADTTHNLEAQTDTANDSGGKKKGNKNNQQEATTEETTTTTTVSCADYATPKQAQKAFDKDPEGLAALDPDGNGIVCEETTTTTEAAPTPEPTPEQGGKKKNKDKNNQEEASADTTVDQPSVTPPEDIDCIDFQFQEEAQAVFNRDPSDPYNLDPNGDGFACSSLPSSMPITRVPNTGAGAEGGASLIVVLASALLAAAAVATRLRSQSANAANTSKR
jgi:hypothetical protein